MTTQSQLIEPIQFELKRPISNTAPSLKDQLTEKVSKHFDEKMRVQLERIDKPNMLLISGPSEELEHFATLLRLLQNQIKNAEDKDLEILINLAMPPIIIQQPREVMEQARRNAELRTDFLEAYECLDAEQIHELYGSKAANKAALAAKWRKERRIFGIDFDGKTLHPAFQFDSEGKPIPVIAMVLKTVGKEMGPWQIAFWFVSPNPSIGRKRPKDLLDRGSDEVLYAAQRLVETDLF